AAGGPVGPTTVRRGAAGSRPRLSRRSPLLLEVDERAGAHRRCRRHSPRARGGRTVGGIHRRRLAQWRGDRPGHRVDQRIPRAPAVAAPSEESTVALWLNGGAIARVTGSTSAFPGRGNRYLIGVEANWERAEDDAENVAWTRSVLADLEPHAAEGAYLNFPGF